MNYLGAAGHAQVMGAIVPRTQVHLHPTQQMSQAMHLRPLSYFLVSVPIAEHANSLSSSGFLGLKLVCLQRAHADQALPVAKLVDQSDLMDGHRYNIGIHLQSARLNKMSWSFGIPTSLLLIRLRPAL